MKKLLLTLLAAAIMTTALAGCRGGLIPQTDTPTTGNSITDNTGEEATSEPSKQITPVKNDSNAKELKLLETITVGNAMEVTFESCEWTEKIEPSNTDGYYSYMEDKEGEKYFVVRGKIKNLAGENLDISYKGQSAKLVINDTYNADVYAEAEDSDGAGFYEEIKPLQTLNVVFYASVSDELQSLSEKVDLTLKLVNDADYIAEYFDEDEVPFDTYLMTFNN